MPAEWEPHEGTWLQWPHDTPQCRGYQRKLETIWLDMTAALHRRETVFIAAVDGKLKSHIEHQLEHFGIDVDRVRIHVIPTDDLWARDNGPIFVTNDHGQLAITDWEFNGWGRFECKVDALVPSRIGELLEVPVHKAPLVLEGGAIEVNGKGTLMATRSSIINPNRNPGKSREEIEKILGQYLGITHVIWLSGAPPEFCESVGDTTDYHVDIAARFTDESTVLYTWTDDESDPRHPYLKKHLEELRAARTESGVQLTLAPLPVPKGGVYSVSPKLSWTTGSVFTDAAYSNYLAANGVVLVPVYGNVNDERAKKILAEHFPGREIVGIPALTVTEEGGAMHCVTQQQPKV